MGGEGPEEKINLGLHNVGVQHYVIMDDIMHQCCTLTLLLGPEQCMTTSNGARGSSIAEDQIPDDYS